MSDKLKIFVTFGYIEENIPFTYLELNFNIAHTSSEGQYIKQFIYVKIQKERLHFAFVIIIMNPYIVRK